MAESEIGFGEFLSRCFKEAVRTTWDKADSGATVVGVVISVIVHFIPEWEHAMNNIAWEIPVACLASIGGARLLFSPFLIYRKRDNEAKRAVSRMEAELRHERSLVQQPDVALVWDWPAELRRANTLLGLTEKQILVHNRGDEYIYNIRIAPIRLVQEMTFDDINEIAPGGQHSTLARWNGRTSTTTNYVYFFAKEENEQEASNKGWIQKKIHSSGLSDIFFQIPMTIRYECKGSTWECAFDLNYDIGEESSFVKRSSCRISG